MKVKALKAFTARDTNGELTSVAHGAVVEVETADGNQLIADGLAEAYTLVTPTGTLNITENGTYDVAEKASAVVDVSGGAVDTVTVTAQDLNAETWSISYTGTDGYHEGVSIESGNEQFTVVKGTIYYYKTILDALNPDYYWLDGAQYEGGTDAINILIANEDKTDYRTTD